MEFYSKLDSLEEIANILQRASKKMEELSDYYTPKDLAPFMLEMSRAIQRANKKNNLLQTNKPSVIV